MPPKSSVKAEWQENFEGVSAWNASSPNLYMLKARLECGECLDDLNERVGFREVKTSGFELLVNGNPVKLKGFNRHEDHALFGAALPFQAMVADIELIKETGSNTVRTSHYPNDERFLDLCDEYGLFVWEENHFRGLTLEQMQNPNFKRQCADCNREMVTEHFNHPSIIIWGILNEGDSTCEEGRNHYEEQLGQIRALDLSRPLTFASNRPFKDICLDLVDIVSFNIYSGWYNDNDSAHYFDKLNTWLQSSDGKDKPVIISEFGAAAVYGMRESSRVKWS